MTDVWPLQNEKPELVMDLLIEQGPERMTQVQPPLSVWREFFDIEPVGDHPEYSLRNVRTGEQHKFGVVGHDHNWTIEIPDSDVPRPAIIVMRKDSDRELAYGPYSVEDEKYAEINRFLHKNGVIPEPQQKRRQYIFQP